MSLLVKETKGGRARGLFVFTAMGGVGAGITVGLQATGLYISITVPYKGNMNHIQRESV